MIEINLLPEDLKGLQKKKKSTKVDIKMPEIPLMPVLIASVSIFIFVHLCIGLLFVVKKNQLGSLTKKHEVILPEERKALVLKDEFDNLNEKFTIIDSLTKSTFAWSRKLHDLSEAMTDGVWLTSLSLKVPVEKSKTISVRPNTQRGLLDIEGGEETSDKQVLVLEGSAASSIPGQETAIVAKFIKSLKASTGFFSDFEDIKITTIERKKLGAAEVMDFTIMCYFKPGENYFEKLESRNF